MRAKLLVNMLKAIRMYGPKSKQFMVAVTLYEISLETY